MWMFCLEYGNECLPENDKLRNDANAVTAYNCTNRQKVINHEQSVKPRANEKNLSNNESWSWDLDFWIITS